MRVLQVHNRYREPGGEDVVVAAEAQLLRDAGHEVLAHVVTNPQPPARAAGALALAPWNPWAARRLREVAVEYRPDIAHVHNTWFSLSSAVLAPLRRLDIPTVMTVHNYRFMCANAQLFRADAPCELCVGTHPWHAVRYRCYRDSAAASAVAATAIALNTRLQLWERNVDLFLALSEFSKRRLVAAGLPETQIRVKPNFVSDPGPRPHPPSESDKVLYVGRISREKGLETVLQVWQSAPHGLELLVLGEGPGRAELEARRWDRVRFLGQLPPDAVRAQMLRARALVFPSKMYEGQPMVTLEAFAAGLPVVANDHGSAGEELGHMPEWLVSPGDPGAWRNALGRLVCVKALDAASAALRRMYEEKFSPSVGLRLLEDAYGAAS